MANMLYYTSNLLVATMGLLLVAVHANNSEIPVIAIVGKDIVLKCDLQRGNPAVIRWTDYVYNTGRDPIVIWDSSSAQVNNMHPNKDNFMVSGDSMQLTIKGVTLDSAGDYFCESQVDATTKHTKAFQLTVGGMPHCTGKTELMDGDRLELTCETQTIGADMPTLEWFLGTMAIDSEDATVIGKLRRIVKQDSSWDMDKEKFTCKMTFGDMEEECSMTMDIKYRVRDLRFTPQQESYRVGQEVRCEARGNPAPTITLLPDAVTQKEGDGYKSLVIDALWEGMESQLHCSAYNTYLSTPLTKNITFQVLEPAPVDGGAKPAAMASTAAIIAGIIIGALVLVIIIVIIVCIRRRKGKKIPKGAKPVPTKDEEIRREMDRKA